jgi:hypothetical protein
MHMTDGPNREQWVITLSREAVKTALNERIRYRKERIDYWKDQLNLCKQRLQTEGVNYSEAFDQFGTVTYSNAPLLAGQFQAQLDPKLVQAVREAHQKITEHTTGLRKYEVWVGFIAAMEVDRQLFLKQEDFEFFYENY